MILRAASILLLAVTSASPAALAQGVSARFGNDVATVGRDVAVSLEVEDPSEVVARVTVELRRPDEATWTATSAHAQADGRWQATFLADAVWRTGPAPAVLELRALMYGRRGGLVLVLGELSPFEMDALPPALAAARTRALSRAAGPSPEVLGSDNFSLAGYVGVEARLGSSARARAFIAAGGTVTERIEILGHVVVGPAFAEPADLAGGGPLALGFELGGRGYVRPVGEAWNLFAEPFVSVELRLPGVDPGAGLRVGGLYWLSPEVAAEATLGGAGVAFSASPGDGEATHFGFTGGLRVGVRFGPERRQESVK